VRGDDRERVEVVLVTDIPLYSPSRFAQTDPERPAVITAAGHIVTFAEMEARSCQLAQALYAYGLRPGDHVAVIAVNDDRTLDIAWGLTRSGLYLTFVNTHLAPEEAAYIINDCGARVLIASAALDPLPAALAALTPDFDLRIAVGDPVPEGYRSYDEFVAGHPTTPLAEEFEGSPMLYSSGTTGRPKGIRRPLSGLPFGSDGVLVPMLGGIMGFTEGDVYLNPAPLYHAAPLAWSMTAQRLGGTVVVMERFDPEECLRLIEEHKVTHAQFVPTMFVRLLKLPDEVRRARQVSSLRAVLHAAAPCAPEVKRRMIEWWGPILEEFYAGTEGGGMTWINSAQSLAHPGSVGPAIWGEIHICDDAENDLPTGEDGVIWFGGTPNAFEYHNDPEKTKQTLNERGWTTLWDVGHLDEEGYLYLTDRKTFMIVSGGVNIYPQEIENVLVLHPAVADVAVIGVPDPDMGEQVKAVVQPAPGAVADAALAQELLDYCREHLSHYKCPRTLDFTDALPRGENGKLYKKQLRDAYWASSTLN
jgi:long-chain acyl-CoA synthetase